MYGEFNFQTIVFIILMAVVGGAIGLVFAKMIGCLFRNCKDS